MIVMSGNFRSSIKLLLGPYQILVLIIKEVHDAVGKMFEDEMRVPSKTKIAVRNFKNP
jgi:hypothetical protein